jgi:hyaluronan synthase
MSEVSLSSVAFTSTGSFSDAEGPAPHAETRAEEPMPHRGVTPLPLKTAALRSVVHVALPNPGEARRSPWFDIVAKGAILLGLAGAFGVAMARNQNPFLVEAPRFDLSSPIALFWQISGIVGFAYFFLTIYFALRYRAVNAPSDAALPSVTVVVPAYNEGAMVRVSLLSALENRYPSEKLEILAIDDGSTDDTWEHIQAVARAFPGRVTPIKQPKNGGKREALRTGFERAKGEFIVTVDSDSQLEPDALRNIVAPMVADARVAAVAGKVLVLNRYENLFTRFLSARFFVTFDLLRAAQSRFGAVLCTPGALSAYRTSGVRAVLNDWATQTFLGAPCTIGEDRALNTWLLRLGHRAVYQSNAIVRTVMPTDFKRITKMMTRWERGNIREDFVMLPVLATSWRREDRFWPTFEILLELMQYPAGYVAFALSLNHFWQQPGDLARVAVSLGVGALIQSLYALRSERSTDFVYGVGYAFWAFVGLQWISPYSFLTLRDGRWMTR